MEVRRTIRAGPAPPNHRFGPLPLRDLWGLVNRAHPIEPAAIRAACAILFIGYVITSIVRHVPNSADLAIRAVMAAYTAAGIIWAPRFSWRTERVYTVGMALLLPSTTAILELLHGNHPADLALTALAIFAPTIFLQTAADVLTVFAILAGGIIALVITASPPGVPVSVAGIVLGGALMAGAATALVLIAFRSRVGESTTWWQDACARERALREFIELAAPHLGDQVLSREFAARLRSAFGPGHCAVVLVDPGTRTPRVLATAGAAPGDSNRPAADAAALADALNAVSNRQPLVCERLTSDDVQRRFAGLPWLVPGGTLVILPIAAADVVAGAIVLSASGSRPIEPEELLLWRAMANQVGVAVGSARLFTRLQEALRARSEFINTMSHELRTPLHVILGYVDMVAEGTDQAFVAERIRASALELLQLLENTLCAASLGIGKMRLQPSEFPLSQLVTELRESVGALPEAAQGVPVRWEVAADLPVVRLDRLKVKEIVHNLTSNALKFTERGEVVVRIGSDDHQVRVDVEDTGTGIPRDAQARIFEMFERVEPVNGPRAPGVGLGLYIVRSLVRMMGGAVTLASEPGRGSCFTVLLPIGGE